jgi:NAD(P)-dependent dehydrogenase (short-subunit alcohol dehydrogenase family)
MKSSNTPVCIITGGSSGIGFATARKFLQQGFHVALCSRNPARVNQALHDLTTTLPHHSNNQCLAQALDITDPEALKNFINKVHIQWERIDVLINNAGTASLASVDQLPPAEFRNTISLNIEAVYHAVTTAWPVMLKQGQGTIINVSSMAAIDPFVGFSVYGATKAWVNTYTQAIATEGRPHGIHAFAVCPGFVETELKQRLFPDSPPRLALSPEQVADAIHNLSLPAMKIASGEFIRLLK